jgi:hypothetical protein
MVSVAKVAGKITNLYYTSFSNSDYGLAHALGFSSVDDVPIMVAYDSACSYSVNIASRFKERLSHLYEVISKIRFVIDSLHVHDHIDRCMILFSTAYQICAAHFHGVGVEQFWSVQNESGSKTSQMNPGHRTDTITEDIGDYNWRKTVKLGEFYDSSTWKLLTLQ